jgi:transposase
VAEAANRNWRLPSQAEAAARKWTQNHRLGEFRAFAAQHGDKTQAEMAELWEGQISARTISRALHKIGFTRKKRRMATLNGMKRSDKPS